MKDVIGESDLAFLFLYTPDQDIFLGGVNMLYINIFLLN